MATLPERRYSERGLQVSQPTPVSPEAAATTGKMFVAIGDEVSDLAQKLEKAHLVAEEIKADSIFEKKSADIQARAALEQDVTPEKLKSYQSEYDKAQEEASNAISIESYRGLYKTKVSSKSTVGKYKLADTFHTKFKDIANSEYANLREMYKANFLASNNPKEKEMAIQELGEKIQARVSAGYISRVDGQKEYEDTIKEWNRQQGYVDIENNPQAALVELNKGSEGNYAEVDPDTRATLRKSAEAIIKKREAEAKKEKEVQYDTNLRQAMIDMMDGKLPYSELENRFRKDIIKDSDFNSLERKLVTPDYQFLRDMVKSDPIAYNEIREAISSRSAGQGELDRMILGALNDEKLKNDDAKYLMGLVKQIPQTRDDQLTEAGAASIREWAENQIKLGFIDAIFDKGKKSREIESIVQNFYSQVDEKGLTGDGIVDAAKSIKSDYLKKRYPEINNLEDVPHILVGIDGKIKRLLGTSDKTKLKPKYKITRVETPEEKPKK